MRVFNLSVCQICARVRLCACSIVRVFDCARVRFRRVSDCARVRLCACQIVRVSDLCACQIYARIRLCACSICVRVRFVRASDLCTRPRRIGIFTYSNALANRILSDCKTDFGTTTKTMFSNRKNNFYALPNTIRRRAKPTLMHSCTRIQFAAGQNRLPMYPNTVSRRAKPITHVPEYGLAAWQNRIIPPAA